MFGTQKFEWNSQTTTFSAEQTQKSLATLIHRSVNLCVFFSLISFISPFFFFTFCAPYSRETTLSSNIARSVHACMYVLYVCVGVFSHARGVSFFVLLQRVLFFFSSSPALRITHWARSFFFFFFCCCLLLNLCVCLAVGCYYSC